MKYLTFGSLFTALSLFSAPLSMPPLEGDHKIGVQNSILTHVNDTTISVVDVKKKLDYAFHQSYPQLADSTEARFQFYQGSWRQVLMEMIDNELMLADAAEREIKLTDGEVREEMENRFGPNVMQTLDRIGLSYDETWKMLKNEMLVQRMVWFFIHSKAIQKVTPQEIKQAYRMYLKENPPYQEWTYRVISLRADQNDVLQKLADATYKLLSDGGQSPESVAAQLKELETQYAPCSIQLSTEYKASDTELSEAHRTALAALTPGQYSKPSTQTSRVDKKTVSRIFYLSQKTDHPAPKFEEISARLKSDLTQKAVTVESTDYLSKLRKHYGFDPTHLKESLPEDLNPFVLQ